MTKTVDWNVLQRAAQQALSHAYAPYSSLSVAAALLADDGSLFTGVNVENASYGLAQCAERNAVAAAVGAGARRFEALLVVSSSADVLTPCGACRQVLSEFPPAFPVRCLSAKGQVLETDTAALLPQAFALPRGKK